METVAAPAVLIECVADGRFSFVQLQSFITESSAASDRTGKLPLAWHGGIRLVGLSHFI
jgi:hypothetical protein